MVPCLVVTTLSEGDSVVRHLHYIVFESVRRTPLCDVVVVDVVVDDCMYHHLYLHIYIYIHK